MMRVLPTSRPNLKVRSDLELSRILSAAVINNRFEENLLADPVAAISEGYCGEKFTLEIQELQKLGKIRASNLADFAAQLSF